MPFPNPEPPTHRWPPEARALNREVLCQIYAILSQKRAVFQTKQPQHRIITARQRKTDDNCCDQLGSLVPLVASNSTICPRKIRKMVQKWPKTCALLAMQPLQPKMGCKAIRLKILFRGHLVHQQAPPHLFWFPTLQIAQTDAQTPIPVLNWLPQAASLSPQKLGPNAIG